MAEANEKKVTLKLFSDFRLKLWKTRDQSGDVELICGNGENKMKAHKIILVATSKFFARQLEISNVVNLKDVNPVDLKNILEFIYKGQVTILDKNKENFIITAKKLNIVGTPRVKRQLIPEILIKIFGYLRTKDLLKNVALVSKQFYELTKDFQVPLTFDGLFYERKDKYFEGILRRANQIEKMCLGPLTKASQCALITSSMKSMKNVKTLKIIGPENKLILNEALLLLPLRVLCTSEDISQIGHCRTLVCVTTHVKTLPEFKALAYLTHLKILKCNLNINVGVSMKDIEEVFSHLTQLVKLDLSIDHMQISAEHLSALAKAGPKLNMMNIYVYHFNILFTPNKLNAFLENHNNIKTFLLNILFTNILELKQTFRQKEFPKFKMSKKSQRLNTPSLINSCLISLIRAPKN